ncbi:FecR family protein [Polaribacter gangjinensis]|uniref:FecR protein domain-containing protein n=1 Tax=Polaribacter gangjinensis TaxID=574710 RepID=A0A2S7WEI2_9FLAO|nr:FecR family protein [Polaribacter gangjinensis]PQJ76039.1 hypothetical protein BTO13_12745 [Polaribacter gangjinensis]
MDENITNNDTFLAKWLAEEITDEQLKEFVSESEFLNYKKIKEGIKLYEYLEAPSEGTFANIKNKIAKKQSIKNNPSMVVSLFTKSVIAVAASVAIIFGVNSFLNNQEVNFESGFGEFKTIALLDNSEVLLNAKSSLSYTKKDWKNNRNVRLNGEAFFKVQKGSTFNVLTDNGTISVLGTQFSVHSQDGFFEVICYKGKVKVTSQNNEYILTPSKSVRVVNGKVLEDVAIISDTQPSWIAGETTFKSVPLKVVIDGLEKQFNIKIESKSIDNTIVFSGSFDNKNLDIALASVFKTTGLNYKITNSTVILSK